MKKKISLPMQILIALILGIVVGFACYAMQVPDFTTNYLKPFGDIFVNLLKFIVVPVVLLSMIDGILSYRLDGDGLLEIFAPDGHAALSQPVSGNGSIVPAFATGVYVARLTAGSETATLKIVVK